MKNLKEIGIKSIPLIPIFTLILAAVVAFFHIHFYW